MYLMFVVAILTGYAVFRIIQTRRNIIFINQTALIYIYHLGKLIRLEIPVHSVDRLVEIDASVTKYGRTEPLALILLKEPRYTKVLGLPSTAAQFGVDVVTINMYPYPISDVKTKTFSGEERIDLGECLNQKPKLIEAPD